MKPLLSIKSASFLSLSVVLPIFGGHSIQDVYASPVRNADSIPINKWTQQWQKISQISGVEYDYTIINPPEGSRLEDAPCPGYESCSVVDNNDHPLFVLLPDGTYMANLRTDKYFPDEMVYGKLDLNSGKFDLLKSGDSRTKNNNFFAYSLSGNSSDAYELTGCMPINKTMSPLDDACLYQPAQMLIKGLTYQVAALNQVPFPKGYNNTSTDIIAQGSYYASISGFGQTEDGLVSAFELVKKNGEKSPDKWQIIETKMVPHESRKTYIVDDSRQHIMYFGNPIAYCDLGGNSPLQTKGFDADDFCFKLPPPRYQGLEIEGFHHDLKKFIVSYPAYFMPVEVPNDDKLADVKRCMYLMDFDEPLIDPSSKDPLAKCPIPLPEKLDAQSWGRAKLSDNGQMVTYTQHSGSLDVSYVAFNLGSKEKEEWSPFMVLSDIALDLKIDNEVPIDASYQIDSSALNAKNELEIVGSVVSGSVNDGHRTGIGVKLRISKDD